MHWKCITNYSKLRHPFKILPNLCHTSLMGGKYVCEQLLNDEIDDLGFTAQHPIIHAVDDTRRYGPLCGPTSSSCGGLQPSAEAFFALRAKKELIMLFWLIFGNFWCPVVALVTFSSNLSNFEKNPKLDTRISFVRSFSPSRSYYPPWNLKRAGLESSGRIASSYYWKTKRIALFFNKKKYKKNYKKSEFLRFFELSLWAWQCSRQ